jgi:TonB family protein
MEHLAHRAPRSTATFTRLNERYVRTCAYCLAISAGVHLVCLNFVLPVTQADHPPAMRAAPTFIIDVPYEIEIPPVAAVEASAPAPAKREVRIEPEPILVPDAATPEPAPAPAPVLRIPASEEHAVLGSLAPPAGGQEAFVAFDTPPERLLEVRPEYPTLAIEAHSQGVVLVLVTIDETGKVIEAVVVSSNVIVPLEEAAIKAARATPFRPAKQRDVPVKARVVLPFRFALTEAKE